jgi:hypothetical protein
VVIEISSIITIGGVDYTKYADAESIDVQDTVIMTKDTMSVNIELAGELPPPSESQEIIWTVDGKREFAGVIAQVTEVDLGTALQYQISAVSYEHWFNRHLVINYYNEMPADQMVKSIVGQFTHGFTTKNVQPSYTIAPKYFNYVTPSDALDKIAGEISWGWYIDYYKDVHFFPFEQFVSPLPNNSLYADGAKDTVHWSDLQLTEDGSQKKTRIYLKGFKSRVSTPVTLIFTGDGQTMQWQLGYKPSYRSGDIQVWVGNQQMNVKRDLVDGSPNQNTTDMTSAFINYSQAMVRLNFAPDPGVQVKVTFYYLADTIVMREDPQAQKIAKKRDGDGFDGRYEYAHTESSMTNSTIEAANAKGDMLLYQYAYPQLQAQFTSFTRGWRSGQYFYLRSKRRMGGRYDGQKMFVQTVEKKLVHVTPNSPAVLQYTITAASTPYLV